jgi:hypothetical protein
LRVRAAADEAERLELVDHHGRVRRVDAQRRGQLAHRHGAARHVPDRPGTAEAQPHRVGDLAPALVVEDEIGHQRPDLGSTWIHHAPGP